MSEAVNLKRARIVEFTSGPRMTAVRTKRGDPFRIVALDSNPDPATALPNDWDEAGVGRYGKDVNVLAEFPLTLADLIPEDCQAFQFSSKDTSITDTAVFNTTFNAWEVTGIDGCHATLESLALEFDIDLDTVIPLVLTAHPDYVEARR